MTNLDTLYARFVNALQNNARSTLAQMLPAQTYGYLGGLDDNGSVALQVTGKPNFVYVFNEVEGMQQQALNMGVPLIAEWPVIIWELRNTLWVTTDPERLEEFAANNPSLASAVAWHTHDLPESGLYDFVSTMRIRIRQIRLVSGTTIQLQSAFYLTNDGNGVVYFNRNAHSDIDLATHQPTAGARRWAFPGVVRSTGVTDVLEGSEIALSTPITPSEFEEFDFTDFEPWKAISLYNQATLTFQDVYDVPLWSGRVAWGTPNVDYEHPMGAGVIKTLSSDTIAAGGDRHLIVAAQTGVTDSLIEITGLVIGLPVIVRADAGDTITVKHNDAGATDKLLLHAAADLTLTGNSTLELIKTESGKVVQIYHNHAAADITSGTLVHERGGLEADVSAYNGLVKIAGGATSAVAAPLGAVVGDTDTQTLSGKTIDGDSNTLLIATSDANVSSPPTAAELDTAFGARGDGFTAVLDDAGAGTTTYLIVRKNSKWWHLALTEAT